MVKNFRKFTRAIATRPYRRIFRIFPEGYETEPSYFEVIRKLCPDVHISIHCHSSNTHPQQILARAKKFINDKKLGKHDLIWLVVDVDYHDKKDLQPLIDWAKENKNYGAAISNPNFEYWILLHFEKGDGIKNMKDCENRLKKHLPNYKKNYLDEKKLIPNITTAITNAKNKHRQSQDWHSDHHTTVYELVESIISTNKSS